MECPEFCLATSSFCPQLIGAEKRQYSSDNKITGDHFVVEEFLDFSNEEDSAAADSAAGFDASAGVDSSTVAAGDSCNSSSSFSGCDPHLVADFGSRNINDGQIAGDLCVPYDDLAELEWLSNIVEESFSSEDLQRLQLISGIKALSADESSDTTANPNDNHSQSHHDHHHNVSSVPAKARSKRSRATPCNWTSRLLLLSSSSSSNSPETTTSGDHSSSDVVVSVPANPPVLTTKKKVKSWSSRKKEAEEGGMGDAGVEGRRCIHCATDKTPQWRTGPMGPKTLCNACGVRFKSGRLVPEYRPAASPTFVLTKHSNSHRKVLELRRQKDFMRAHQQQQQQFLHHPQNGGLVFDHHAPMSSNGEDFLIHHHVGTDFRQMP